MFCSPRRPKPSLGHSALRQIGYRSLCVGGGVAANSRFRDELERLTRKTKLSLYTAPMSLCTGNAAMGRIAWELLLAGRTVTLDVDVQPGLVRF